MTTVPRKCASALEPTRWALACVLVSRVVRARQYTGRVHRSRLSPTRRHRAEVVPGRGLPGPVGPDRRGPADIANPANSRTTTGDDPASPTRHGHRKPGDTGSAERLRTP